MPISSRFSWLVGFALLVAFQAIAQDFPRKSITIVASSPPGGGVDLITRILARALSEEWKQTVVVENRSGAGGIVGTQYVANAQPDGYTLLTVSLGHATNPSLYQKMPYDTMAEFTPLSLLAKLTVALTVNKSLPVNSVKELIAYAKANPEKLSCGSGGNGSSQHLACEMFKNLAGLKILHIPYRGVGAARTDLIGGQIQIMFDQISFAAQNVQSGNVKVLAVTTMKRSPLIPNIPTMDEAGLAGYDVVTWFGLLGPSNLPRNVIEKLRIDLPRIMAKPEIRKELEKQTFDSVFSGPSEFDLFLKQEMIKWDKVIKEAGIQPS